MLPVGSLGAFAYALSQRVPLGLDVIRDRKALFRERAGRAENIYTLKLPNMDARLHRYDLHAAWIRRSDLSTDGPIEAAIGPVVETPVRLMAEESRLESRSTLVTFVLIAADDDRLSLRESPASSARRHEPAPISSNPSTPWYREPYVSLLIAIPAVAVLAGLITWRSRSRPPSPRVRPTQGATPSQRPAETCQGRYGITPQASGA